MEVLGHAVGATANELAIHSMAVMDRFSNGEAYNETVWIERGRFAVRQSGTVRSVANQSLDPTSIVGSDGKSSKCLGGSLGGFCKDLGV